MECNVSCFANNDSEFEAIGTFHEMLENGLYPNELIFWSLPIKTLQKQLLKVDEQWPIEPTNGKDSGRMSAWYI
jgi:pentatricopeptide repeat protein